MAVKSEPEQGDFPEPLQPVTGLDDFLYFRLRRTVQLLDRALALATRTPGRPGSRGALGAIYFHPGISQNEMSRIVGLDKSVTVQILDDLEARGLAMRRPSPTDRRRHALYLTDEGKRTVEMLIRAVEPIRRQYMRNVSNDEIEHLFDVLDRICAALGAEGARPPGIPVA